MEDSKTSYESHESDSHSDSISNYLDAILDLYYALLERLSFSPLFLFSIKSTDLTNFIENSIDFQNDSLFSSYQQYCLLHKKKYNDFIHEYKNELFISFNMVSNFLVKSLKSPLYIKERHWAMFCFNFT